MLHGRACLSSRQHAGCTAGHSCARPMTLYMRWSRASTMANEMNPIPKRTAICTLNGPIFTRNLG